MRPAAVVSPALHTTRGLTLIEVLVSISVLLIILVAVNSLQVSSLRASKDAALSQQASALVRDRLETLRATGLPQLTHACDVSKPTQQGSLTLTCTAYPCAVQSQVLNCETTSVPVAAYRVSFVVKQQNKEILQAQTVVSQ